MSFLHHRKIYFANANYEAFSDFPVLFKVDNSAGAFPDLNAYNNLSFHAANGARIPWGCKEFNAGGVSVYKINVPSIAKSDTDYCYMYYGGDTSTEDKAGTCDSAVMVETPMVDYGDTSHVEDWTGAFTPTKKGAGEPASASGSMGLCQDFDGSNDYIDIADAGAFDVDTELTVELYFKHETPINYIQNILSHGVINADGWYLFTTSTGDAIGVRLNQSGATQAQYIFGGGFATGNYYLAFTLDNSGAKTVISAFANSITKINEVTSTVKVANNAARNFRIAIDDSHTADTSANILGYLLRISTAKRSANWLKAQDKILRTQDYVTFGEQVDRIRSYVNPVTVLIKDYK